MSDYVQATAWVLKDQAKTVLRDETHVWASTGGKFEWKLALNGIPANKRDFAYLKGSIEFAMDVIERAIDSPKFTGFDGIEIDATQTQGR